MIISIYQVLHLRSESLDLAPKDAVGMAHFFTVLLSYLSTNQSKPAIYAPINRLLLFD